MQLEITLPVLTVFAQGLLSFFSPCVLPLVPLYLGYLAAGAKTVDENGGIRYRRGRVALNTFFFVLGISFAFFLLTLGFTAVGRFFTAQKHFLPGSVVFWLSCSVCISWGYSVISVRSAGSDVCRFGWTV